jgi:hypothetical protein
MGWEQLSRTRQLFCMFTACRQHRVVVVLEGRGKYAVLGQEEVVVFG